MRRSPSYWGEVITLQLLLHLSARSTTEADPSPTDGTPSAFGRQDRMEPPVSGMTFTMPLENSTSSGTPTTEGALSHAGNKPESFAEMIIGCRVAVNC